MRNKYKYRIYELLQDLRGREAAIAKNWLPEKLGVSHRTFDDWKYITQDSTREIPFDKAFQLATFFKVEIAALLTDPPERLDLAFQQELAKKNVLTTLIK